MTPGVGPFRPQGHYLSKPGRGPLGDTKYLGFVVSDKKIFSHFAYISLCKTCDPLGGAISSPRVII